MDGLVESMIEPTRRWRPSWQVVTAVIVLVILGLWKLTSGISGTPDAVEDEPTVPAVVLTGDDQIALDENWERVDLPGRSALRDVCTFLMATGYEQVRSVAAAIDGDWQSARNVELTLPASGVCGVASPLTIGSGPQDQQQSNCC